MAIPWIVCVYFGYKTLQNLNHAWDNYDMVSSPNRMPLIEQLQIFDKWMVSLFCLQIVFGLLMIKIMADYSNFKKTQAKLSTIDSLLCNDYTVMLMGFIFFVGACGFFVIWDKRKYASSDDTQFTHRTSFNVSYNLFIGSGILLIPLFLYISFQTPFSTETNKIKQPEDFINEIVQKKKSQLS